jgi:hypothetical protein
MSVGQFSGTGTVIRLRKSVSFSLMATHQGPPRGGGCLPFCERMLLREAPASALPCRAPARLPAGPASPAGAGRWRG